MERRCGRSGGQVGNPTILATFAVIAAILPMAFVRGLMGPYMRPIPVGASAAMLFSLMVAFVVSPWAALRLLRGHTGKHAEGETEGKTTKFYRKRMSGLIQNARKRWAFLGNRCRAVAAGVFAGRVQGRARKDVPFDTKSEFQVIVDMPEGTPLERTLAVEQEIGSYLAHAAGGIELPDICRNVGAVQLQWVGAAYYLRRGANQGDIQVNCAPWTIASARATKSRRKCAGHPGDREEMECAREMAKFHRAAGCFHAGGGSVWTGLSAAN